jgi:hypothetical protein
MEFYIRLKRSVSNNLGQDFEEINTFTKELPHNLRIELSLYIHEETYKSIAFLRDKT